MIKNIILIVITAAITVVGTIVTISWEDEALSFYITNPVKFENTYYHNLKIHNKGWSPALNVKLEVEQPNVIKLSSSPNFDKLFENKNIVEYSRIRRNEIVNITILATKPITLNDISIKSDRSIASYSKEQQWFFDFYSFIIGVWVLILIFGIALLFSARQFKEFRKKAYQAKSDADTRGTLVETLEENMKLEEDLEALRGKNIS